MNDITGKVEVDVVLKPRTNRAIALGLACDFTNYDDFRNDLDVGKNVQDDRTELVLDRANQFYQWLEGQ